MLIVNYIFGATEFNADQMNFADLNDDGMINVLDIVSIVQIILGNLRVLVWRACPRRGLNEIEVNAHVTSAASRAARAVVALIAPPH